MGQFRPDQLDRALIRRTLRDQLTWRLAEFVSGTTEAPTAEGRVDEALTCFLETGQLPWDAPFTRIEELERAAMALAPAPGRRVAGRIRPLLQHRRARLRLIHQFTRAFYEWIVETLHPEGGQRILEATAVDDSTHAAVVVKERLLAVLATTRPRDMPTAAMIESKVRRHGKRTDGPPPDPGSPQDKPEARDPGPNREIYVDHAGLVLLHPFLERFFGYAGLLDERRRFVSEAMRARAIHLLYHVATGAEEPAENEATLCKVMCGLAVHEPLVRRLHLRSEEREESKHLLEAVVQHWGKLGNTSPQGLREGFLQRQGKLVPEPNRWHLVVEQRSIDVLLDSLPWSLTVVRLPWMESPLYIDWA